MCVCVCVCVCVCECVCLNAEKLVFTRDIDQSFVDLQSTKIIK